jgi:flagellar hook-associated protein 1 FlgK
MTIPTYTGMQTSLSGLQAYMAAIDTTGENITNANTPGYTRQRVDLGSTAGVQIPALSSNFGLGAQVGTGVSIDGITRVRDDFLDTQFRSTNGQSSGASTLASELGQVQTALDEPSTAGVSTALQNFWSAWNAMAGSDTPSSQTAVVGAFQTLQSTMASVSQQMQTVQTQAGQQLTQLTGTQGQVMTDATQIQSLNTEIEREQAGGQTPNDLLDQRDQLLDDLSSLATTTVTPNSDGAGGVSVSFGGQTLIDSTNTLSFDPTAVNASSGGELGALAGLADTSSAGTISPYLTDLDNVAAQLVTEVNGQTSTPVLQGTTVATLSIAGSDPQATVAGVTAPQAQAISALAGGQTDQTYASFVDTIGTAVQSAQNTASTQQSLLSAIATQRQSVSGVSLDEEMANLIMYQQGYQASARMMNTMDSVIGDLINTVGSAGM